MAFITLAGSLKDPNSDLSIGDQVRFTQQSTTGETLEGAVSVVTISVLGTYSVNLQYGLVLVEYRNAKNPNFRSLGIKTVNANNPATSIPELLTATVPVSSADLIAFQTILADAVTAESGAVTAKNSAVTAETGAVTARNVAVAASIIQYQTFAELLAISETVDYKQFTVAERANAAYTLQPAGYVALSGDATLANSRVASLQIDGAPHIDNFGGQSAQSLSSADSSFDNKDVIASIVSRNNSDNYSGFIQLGSGYYRTTETVDCLVKTLYKGLGMNESFIHADHLAGPAIRFRSKNSGVIDMGVTASSNRRSQDYVYGNTNFGILYETDDVIEASTGRNSHAVLQRFYVYGHPSGSVHVVGAAFTGSIQDFDLSLTKGHGFSFDRGEATNRVNLLTGFISGICNITNGKISNTAGHAVACGSNTSSFSTPSLRVIIDNIEGGGNATNKSILYHDSVIYLKGANHTFMNSGMDVEVSGSSCYVSGRNITLKNNRALESYDNMYVIGTHDELPTNGIYIEGFSVINPDASLDPAILLVLPAGETIRPRNIHINQGEDGNITKMIAGDSTFLNQDFRGFSGIFINGSHPVIYKKTDDIINNSTTLQNDGELKIWMESNDTIEFTADISYSSTPEADIKIGFSIPASATLNWSPISSLKITSSGSIVVQNRLDNSDTLVLGGSTAPSERVTSITGTCYNASTSGFITLQFAQLTAEATDTKILKELTKIRFSRLVS